MAEYESEKCGVIVTMVSAGKKELWHRYSLQTLTTERFATVVGKILTGEYGLFILDRPEEGNPCVTFPHFLRFEVKQVAKTHRWQEDKAVCVERRI